MIAVCIHSTHTATTVLSGRAGSSLMKSSELITALLIIEKIAACRSFRMKGAQKYIGLT